MTNLQIDYIIGRAEGTHVMSYMDYVELVKGFEKMAMSYTRKGPGWRRDE